VLPFRFRAALEPGKPVNRGVKMFKSLVPKNEIFYELFDQISANTVEGVQTLVRMLDDCDHYNEHAVSLKSIEHQTDLLVHNIMSHLHKTFVTPIDREDIHQLASRLDDILDLAEAASSRIDLYRPCAVPSEAKELGHVLLESVKLVKEMVGLLRNLKKPARIMELNVEINRLEDQADYIRRSTLARLFREEKDPFELIKWKDILEYIERATDRCEDVADITEGIVLENT
jgi:predicted phosphate transport protein (TIGR00153 family)